MKMHRIGLLAFTLTSVAALAAANAADMYRAPEPFSGGGYKDGPVYSNWAGFYVGVNGGYAFDAQNRHGGIEDNGGFGGGQIGYNWQGILHQHLVLGVEADIQGSGIDNKGISILVPSGIAANHEIDINYFGTVRGRLGYAAGQLLVYGTGGFAYGSVNNRFVEPSGAVFVTDKMQTGFAAGGGLEYKVSPAWSAKAEYQFIDLSHDNAVSSSGRFITTRDTELNTVRAGLNYHFTPGYEPLK